MGFPPPAIRHGEIPTPRLLRRLRRAVVTTATIALVGCYVALLCASAAVARVNDDLVPATGAVAAAWTGLRGTGPAPPGQPDAEGYGCTVGGDADDPAAGGCPALLIGGAYRTASANAVQYLAELAGHTDLAAERRAVQVAQTLTIRYLGLMEQADHYRGQGNTLLIDVYLGYAGGFLEETVRPALDQVRDHVAARLAEERDSVWRDPATALAWSVPLAVAVALLVAAQIWFARRFHRRFDLFLLAATATVVAAGICLAQPVLRSGRFDEASGALADAVGEALTAVAAPRSPDATTVTVLDQAARTANLEYVIPAVAAVAVALIVAGFQRRLDEYRLRSS